MNFDYNINDIEDDQTTCLRKCLGEREIADHPQDWDSVRNYIPAITVWIPGTRSTNKGFWY